MKTLEELEVGDVFFCEGHYLTVFPATFKIDCWHDFWEHLESSPAFRHAKERPSKILSGRRADHAVMIAFTCPTELVKEHMGFRNRMSAGLDSFIWNFINATDLSVATVCDTIITIKSTIEDTAIVTVLLIGPLNFREQPNLFKVIEEV